MAPESRVAGVETIHDKARDQQGVSGTTRICKRDLGEFLLVLGGVFGISVAHNLVPHSSLVWHNGFQWLYYIPVVVAAIRFGLLGGMIVAGFAVIGYFPHFLTPPEGYPEDYTTVQYAAAALLLLMSMITGALADRERKRREELQTATNELRRTHEELRSSFDQLRQADRLAVVGEMASGLAHEIRNPLASIRGAVDVLGRPETPGQIREEFHCIIKRESSRLEKLLTGLLDFARPRPPEYETVDIDQQFERIIRLVAKTASREGVALHKSIAHDAPPLECDPHQLEQVVLNLLLNAIQAAESGGSITLSARREDSNMLIQVVDDGCGVAGDIETIFQPFRTTKENGTGLGLAVTRRIVNQQRGTILAQRNSGRGMTFSVLLPLHVARPGSQLQTSVPTAKAASDLPS